MTDKITGVQNELAVAICENSHEAVKAGYFYRQPIYEPIHLNKVVVVKNGMVGGNSSVDLILEDAKGQKYVCMLSAKLLKTIPL